MAFNAVTLVQSAGLASKEQFHDSQETLNGVGGSSGPCSERVFADLVENRPQSLPEMDLPIREPRFTEGEMFFFFSKAEIRQSAEPFRFSVVLKFLRRRPYLDHVRAFIKNRGGLCVMPVVGQLNSPRAVLIRLSNEEDFVSVMARGNAMFRGFLNWVKIMNMQV
ncbi:hypothetical protein I3842_06G053400 [Carya illinoinensis]|uniref:Uncharacterized protein n=1 Tax=Carya illinoinensis TaxID=32201 RepID=A0A922ETK1_CARIL|nr:hypothetical protein I3842_06G053400 [Carya illinoinensis]